MTSLNFGYVYLMKYISKATKKFQAFSSEVEKLLGKSIKALRLDQSEEYLNQDFQLYMRDNEISS